MDPAIGDGSRSSVDGSSEPNQIQSCDICTEQSHSLIVNDSPCSHAICKDCVTMLFSQVKGGLVSCISSS